LDSDTDQAFLHMPFSDTWGRRDALADSATTC
jgi:hypothetical protein